MAISALAQAALDMAEADPSTPPGMLSLITAIVEELADVKVTVVTESTKVIAAIEAGPLP